MALLDMGANIESLDNVRQLPDPLQGRGSRGPICTRGQSDRRPHTTPASQRVLQGPWPPQTLPHHSSQARCWLPLGQSQLALPARNSQYRQTPFILAAWKGHTALAVALVKRGANINAISSVRTLRTQSMCLVQLNPAPLLSPPAQPTPAVAATCPAAAAASYRTGCLASWRPPQKDSRKLP